MRRIASLALLLPLAACGERVIELSGDTMGTKYHVRIVGGAEAAARARVAIDELLAATDARFSLWREDSAIARFNAWRESGPFPVDDEFVAVLRLALRLAAASGGAYDPTILPVTRLWGFIGGEKREPSADELAAALSAVGWQKLEIRADGGLVKLDPRVELDLNSIAPGAAADAISARLKALGLGRHMVDIGGEIVCRGTRPGGDAWQIGIELPGSEPTAPLVQRVVGLRDAALATSGSYRNWFQSQGARRHHIVDAHTGRNAPSPVISVSVEAPEAALADGLSTVLMILGPEPAQRVLDSFAPARCRALFLVLGEDGRLSERGIGW